MKIGIIAKKQNALLTDLAHEAEKRGHDLKFITIDNASFSDLYSNRFLKEAEACDLIHYRTGLGHAGVLPLLTHLKARNIPLINGDYLLNALSENKSYQTYTCSNADVLVPKTIYAQDASFLTIQDLLGLPFITKKEKSAKGKGVALIHTEAEYTEKAKHGTDNMLFQEFIPNSGDYRVHIEGNNVPAMYKRVPQGDEFRSNVTLGGHMEAVLDLKEQEELADVAIRSAKALSLEMGGIDLMRSETDNEIYFIEANRNPGWKNVFAVTGVNLSLKMVEYYEKRLDPA